MTDKVSRIHFIAIGGSIMHNLAINLKNQGHIITGSDDEFFDPSKSKLEKYGLLPENPGWDAERINAELDAVIVGMHAKKDNPELVKAQELGLKVYSFPEYIYEHSKEKQRIVIAGSHGKTTITSMVMHVLNYYNRTFDYAVGAPIEGFETMVSLSNESAYIIIEGDEYLTSPLDLTPKFLKYHHHIALFSGIAWDHANVFPDKNEYVDQFHLLSEATPKAGTIIYNEEDKPLRKIVESNESDILKFPYKTPKYSIKEGKTVVSIGKEKTPVEVFGKHNMSNLMAAQTLCSRLCVSEEEFAEAIKSFTGAGKRLEKMAESSTSVVYRDFAHSPSKLEATVKAVKEQYKGRKLTACLELHTFSSLNKVFLPEYESKFNDADEAIVYFNPKVIEHKKLEALSGEEIKKFFKRKDLLVFDSVEKLEQHLSSKNWENNNLLIMSSGNFDNLDFNTLLEKIN